VLLAGQKVSLPLLYFHQIPPADVLEGDRRLHLLRKAFRMVRSRQKKKKKILIALGCVFRKRWQGSSAREEHHVGWSNWRSHPWVVASSWSYQPIQERKRLLGKLSFFSADRLPLQCWRPWLRRDALYVRIASLGSWYPLMSLGSSLLQVA
jgi:hypothetical protein